MSMFRTSERGTSRARAAACTVGVLAALVFPALSAGMLVRHLAESSKSPIGGLSALIAVGVVLLAQWAGARVLASLGRARWAVPVPDAGWSARLVEASWLGAGAGVGVVGRGPHAFGRLDVERWSPRTEVRQ